MSDVVQTIASILTFALCLGGMACVATAFVNMILMSRRRKPGVPYMRHLMDSPYNIMFRPEDLTDSGLRARRRIFWAIVGFCLCIAMGSAIGISTGVLH